MSSGVLRTMRDVDARPTLRSTRDRARRASPTRSVPTSSESTPETRKSSDGVAEGLEDVRSKLSRTAFTWLSFSVAVAVRAGVRRAADPAAGGRQPVRTAGVQLRAAPGVSTPEAPRLASNASAQVPSSYGLLERVVDPLAHLRVVLGVADADALLGERLADDLELALVLRGVARAGSCRRWSSPRRCRRAPCRRTRSRCRSRPASCPRALTLSSEVEPVTEQTSLPFRSSGPVTSLSSGTSSCWPVTMYGPAWPTTCATLVGDGVRREHEVDLALLEERLAVVGDGLDPLDLGGVVRVDAEARRRGSWRSRRRSPSGMSAPVVLEAEAGLVVLHADVDRARRRRAPSCGCRRRTVAASSATSTSTRLGRPAGVAAGGQRQGQAERRRRRALVRMNRMLSPSVPGRVLRPRCVRSVLEDLAEEVLGAVGLRVGEELLGGVLLDDRAVGHEDAPGRPRCGRSPSRG